MRCLIHLLVIALAAIPVLAQTTEITPGDLAEIIVHGAGQGAGFFRVTLVVLTYPPQAVFPAIGIHVADRQRLNVLEATAVANTTVSAYVANTAPSACLAIRPVSNRSGRPPSSISTT